MVTMHPAKRTVTDFVRAESMYRGMSKPRASWEPRKPLFASVSEWETWALSMDVTRLAYEHPLAPVLKLEREHAVSFSCSSRVARYYGLSSDDRPYSKEQAFVGLFPRAPVRRVHTIGGVQFLYICEDETVWLDLRSFPPSTQPYLAAPSAFEYARDCACVDDELVLVFGKLTASKLLMVKRIPAPKKQHEPWQRTIITMAPHLGLSVPQPPSFTDLLHHSDKEHEATVLASVLGG